MSASHTSQEVAESIKTAYGNLEQPNYSFMKKRYGVLRRHPVVTDLMTRYFVKDDTDLNDHAAVHLRVRDTNGSMLQVCLSFVANFVMLFRFQIDSGVYSEVVDRETKSRCVLEDEVLALLEKHKFRLLSKMEAAAPIEMNLFNTERTDTRIYHAIVEDSGVVPQILL